MILSLEDVVLTTQASGKLTCLKASNVGEQVGFEGMIGVEASSVGRHVSLFEPIKVPCNYVWIVLIEVDMTHKALPSSLVDDLVYFDVYFGVFFHNFYGAVQCVSSFFHP